jgi:hypothetical protein
VFSLSYGVRGGSSYGGQKHRRFGSSTQHRRNWESYPLTGSAKGDLTARLAIRREAEDRLFDRR